MGLWETGLTRKNKDPETPPPSGGKKSEDVGPTKEPAPCCQLRGRKTAHADHSFNRSYGGLGDVADKVSGISYFSLF